MDELVKAAMHKWPDVPDCWGWLALDGRGDWYLRDDAAQAAGPFQSRAAWPVAKGSRLEHTGLLAFIGRNYTADPQGCFYFQNGPQRVYVELEDTPWVWRVAPDKQVLSHTGQASGIQQVWVDEAGGLYFLTDIGFGRVHTSDMWQAAHLLESGAWAVQEIEHHAMPERFGFVRSPQQAAARKKAR